MSRRFVHLTLHSEYSLADSTIRIPELVKRCVAMGQPSVAVTDRNNLFSLVKFFRAAEGAGIKPIAGADISMAEGDEPPATLTLLCRDHDGYLSLSRLLTRAWMEGQRHDGVVVRPDWLREDHAGLFALAGRQSPAGRLVAGGRHDQAEAWVRDWSGVFGDGLHLTLARAGFADEAAFNDFALQAASLCAVPVVAGNEVRFIDREGFEAHEARVCIASGRVLDDPRRPREYTAEQYLKSGEEMAALFADVPDAIDNAVALAQRCNLELRLGTYHLPAFPVPDQHTLDSWIRSEARDGLARRLEHAPLAEGHDRASYAARLETELDVIIRMGFPGYFLIVSDFIRWGKEQGIPVGPGRGSGAGSLVAWALEITDLDPLPYDLLFERFLNPERVSMPDFDIDFCMDRRDEVIDYVARKYGRDRVSQIITYGTMAAKAVVRDAGRALGYPFGLVDGIAKLVPMTLGVSLPDALGRTEKGKKDDAWRSDELIARYGDEDDVRELIDLALQLEDLTRNAGKHAGGVVIAPSPLSDFCPLFAEHDGDGAGRNPVTQFDKDDVEAIGLVKFDFLGLRTLTIIDWAVKAINRRHAGDDAPPLDIASLPLTDTKTYELFARGDTVAVFQFESRGMRELLKRARPDRFEDLIALVSLYRPGPMDLIPDFIERKHGRAEVQYPHPLLEPVLAPTYGVVVYQEQVMQTAQILGGYSLGGADLLRRAMGKKKVEEMARERAKFEDGAQLTHGIEPRVSGPIFDLLEKFAGYGFNKSHAAAYALVSYQTAWLKAHYPAEFMAAVLSSDMDSTDKVVGFLAEARTLGLEMLPPDVNHSSYMFEANDPRTLRYGLGAVKGVGQGACEAIAAERGTGGAYVDLLDFCRRTGPARLNRRTLEALVNAGALDALGPNRASLMLQLPEVLKAVDQLAREREAGQASLFGGFAEPEAAAAQISLPEVPEWPLAQKLAGERDTLGHYLSGHPLDPYRKELQALVGADLGQLDALWESGSSMRKGGNGNGEGGRGGWRQEVTAILAGQVTGIRKRGESQAFVVLEDGRGRIECAFFSEAWMEHAPLLTTGRIVVVEGGLREDEFSGGFSLRARRAWDFHEVCNQSARRLSLRLDLAVPGTMERVEALLSPQRPGPTSLRLDLLLAAGAAGTLDLDGSQSVRVDPDLVDRLRGEDGVRAAHVAMGQRPWAT
ncbi:MULTISPECIES: DNA polymerase III subunit alpha [unclassified Luteimonas]|uniref:DNA polymerase III subunit alpha n=1 Tax=unclassified Luteimonas TaxID=2629088 RepID=UPI0018F0F660|nr:MULTISPECIES: DNA polymerase III subunit alpha [unclassified Luteimonas]MBJ6977984.1 DNA polymerase III subunit alpha [Luteimonas sp. MC1895]MBJ6984804.1 DNA polymerase III subunit alpha [Luteimonas sp. MC1750]QQO07099.1 DNA polymerase III subunit alpha [Luteimonas sp. MC1750]